MSGKVDMERQNGPTDPNVYKVSMYFEKGCDFNEGEYNVEINDIVNGTVNLDDYQLVEECISEFFYEKGPLPDTTYGLTLQETGEWEDVFWHKYYKIIKLSVYDWE